MMRVGSPSAMNKTDMDVQQRELTAAELNGVNGGRDSLVGAGIMAVVNAVFDAVVFPAISAGLIHWR